MATTGQTISHYLLQKKIGSGSFGDVFLALDQTTNTNVALKCSKAVEKFALPDYQQRFMREVECTKILNHPNIVQLLDFGTMEDGTLFLVMNYIDGVSLESIIKREAPIPFMRAARIILQILDALSDAHAKGIVHRDLTPANVMITRHGIRRDFVQLLDFGIAKAFDGTQPDLTSQNLSKDMGFGTPQYMPPEQIYANNIGPYTDIYAVGLVFFEMLTATQPMLGPTVLDTIKKQLAEQIIVPPPFNEGPLADIFRMAFAKDYKQRYQGAEDMYADIDDLLNSMSPYLTQYNQASEIDIHPMTAPVSKSQPEPPPARPSFQTPPPAKPKLPPKLSMPAHPPAKPPMPAYKPPLPAAKPQAPAIPVPSASKLNIPSAPVLPDEIDDGDEASTCLVDTSSMSLEKPDFLLGNRNNGDIDIDNIDETSRVPAPDTSKWTDADSDCKTSICISPLEADDEDQNVSEIKTAIVTAPQRDAFKARLAAANHPPASIPSAPPSAPARQQYFIGTSSEPQLKQHTEKTQNIPAFKDDDDTPAGKASAGATVHIHEGLGNLGKLDYFLHIIRTKYDKIAKQVGALHTETIILIFAAILCIFFLLLIIIVLIVK